MKILVLSFYYPPDLSAGSFRVGSLISPLIGQSPINTEVVVITTQPNRYSTFTVEAGTVERHPQLTIHRIKLPQHSSGMIDQSRSFLTFAWEAFKIMQKERFDLVFATSSRLMTASLGAIFSRYQRSPLYLDIRDIFADTMKEVLPKRFSKFGFSLFSLLEKWTINQASRVNLVSKGFESYFRQRYPKQNFSFFTNGIDDEFLKLDNEKLVLQKSDVKTVLYAGNIGEGQGLHNILPGLAEHFKDKLVFKVIGDGGRKQLLAQKIEEKKYQNIKILPPIGRKLLIKEYQAADVLFLHLNDYEAFRKVLPSKIFEYSVFGKPIWAGVSGYASEFIKTEVSNSAVFSPNNLQEAISVFDNLNFDSINRSRFVEKYSRKRIMSDFAKDILSLMKALKK